MLLLKVVGDPMEVFGSLAVMVMNVMRWLHVQYGEGVEWCSREWVGRRASWLRGEWEMPGLGDEEGHGYGTLYQ
jgi:hypothetical protein